MNNKQRIITLVVGKTGYGKSFYVKSELVTIFPRHVIFDLMSEYVEGIDFNPKGYEIFTDIEDFYEFMYQHTEDKRLRVICQFDDQCDYEYAFKVTYASENTAVIIEEIANFITPHKIVVELESLIRFGRHKSTSIVATTQRINDLHPLFLNNADILVAFNLSDRNDIKRLQSIHYIGDRALEIPSLKKTKYIAFYNS